MSIGDTAFNTAAGLGTGLILFTKRGRLYIRKGANVAVYVTKKGAKYTWKIGKNPKVQRFFSRTLRKAGKIGLRIARPIAGPLYLGSIVYGSVKAGIQADGDLGDRFEETAFTAIDEATLGIVSKKELKEIKKGGQFAAPSPVPIPVRFLAELINTVFGFGR